MQIIEVVSEVLTDHNFEFEIYAGIAALPHFNADLDDEGLPPSIENFPPRIEEAAGALICTPEYVFSLPGTLKNALDRTVSTTVFSDKPAAIIPVPRETRIRMNPWT